MNAQEFQSKAEDLISQFEDLLEQMPQKGNTAEECQRMNLRENLNQLSYSVNGVKDSDFVEDEEFDSEGTPLTRKIIESFGFEKTYTTPDRDDRGLEFKMRWVVLEGLYICNNEPCEMTMLEGIYYSNEGEEHYVCLETKEEIEEIEACETEEEIIEFIESLYI